MSNISRRDFLKTAGVMTLAVAAAGVLAGCEGNAAKPEVPEVTQTSVTVGNYTLSLKDVKQYSVKTYKDGHQNGPTNEVKTEDRYVLAVLSLKAVDESKLDNKPEKLFTLINDTKNLTNVDITDATANTVVKSSFNKLMGLEGEWVVNMNENAQNDISGIDVSKIKKGGCYYYTIAFKVEHTAFADSATDFKTPALSFVVNDAKGFAYTKMEAAIPAVVDLPKDVTLIKA